MTFVEALTGHFSLWQYAEFFLRVLMACGCGAAIGYERSKRLKEAGIRTHIIVCCAAALTMIVSKYGFADLVGADGAGLYGTKGTDPARLAAQIISGVSFLGAGMYVIGVFSTAVVAAIQILTHKFTVGVDSMVVGRLHCVVSHSAEFRKMLNEYIEEHGMQILEVKIDLLEDGSAAYNLTLRMRHDVTVNDLSEFLESVGDVRAVSFELGI